MEDEDKLLNLAKTFSISEAAWLWCSRDPAEYKELAAKFELDTTIALDQFPEVQAKITLILDAILKGELPLRNLQGEHQDALADMATLGEPPCCRGLDIKNWLVANFPEERPAFLFEENSPEKRKRGAPRKHQPNTGDLNIIGALIEFISGNLPGSDGAKHPLYQSDAKLRLQLQDAYGEDLMRLSESNWKTQLSRGRKSVQNKH